MKRTLKKAMSIILAFTLLFGSFAFGLSDVDWADFAVRAEAKAIGDFEYSTGTDSTLVSGIVITGVNKSISGNVIVPSYIESRPVTHIGENAFSNCTAIESVTLPDTVKWIYREAFYGCTSLESITLSSHLSEIGYKAFAKCKSLKSIVILDGTETIGSEAFKYCESLTSVTLPNSITSIYSSTFDGCKKLENITIPNSVTEIGSSAFNNCESLTNITIPEGVTKIGSWTFSNCKKLKNITIPDTVTIIDQYAFSGCSELENITIPNGVTEIGSGAFSGCEKIEGEIIIPASVTSIGSSAFYYCNGLEKITVVSENTAYASDKYGALFTKDKTKLIQYPAGNKNTSYIVPDGVTKVEPYAFYYCNSLKTIVFPDSVTELFPTNISNCTNLECVHIPESITSLSEYFLKGTNIFICSNTVNCYAKEFADANGFEFRVCSGHNVSTPETTTKPAVTEPATTKPIIEPTTKPTTTKPVEMLTTTKPVEVPSTTKPAETTKPEQTTKPSAGFIFKILKPSVSVIKYGETLILHTNLTSISADEKIEWSVAGEGVTIAPSADGKTCAVTSTATGDVTITAKYTDAYGVEHVSEQDIKSNASFWQKIVSFFKNLFGINRIIEQAIKF